MMSRTRWTRIAVVFLSVTMLRGAVADTAAGATSDVAAARARLLGRIPDAPAGAVVFDAAAVRPLVQDDEYFKLERETPAPGMTVAWLGRPSYLLRDPA